MHTHPNTVLTSIATSAAWHTLVQHLGVRRFVEMLLTTAYFAPLPHTHDCFAQLWGEPVVDRVPLKGEKRPTDAPDAPPAKRARRTAPPATSVAFRRTRLFSARPATVYGYGIVLGLPPHHVLNTRGPMHQRTACLARSVFPGEFAPRGGRWPRRLRRVRAALADMVRRHDRFHYAAALNACCPTALPRLRPADLDALDDAPLPARADPPVPASTQAPAAHDSAQTRGLQQLARARSRGEPQFYRYATPHSRVCFYVRTVVRRVVPLALVGSHANRRTLCAAAARLVCARRHERVTLHDALASFRVSHCAWLGAGRARSAAAHARATALVHALVYWLLEHLVVPLVRTTFYATETAAFRQRVLYFRQDLWARVSAPLLARLRSRLFVRERDAGHAAPVAQVRLVPKDTSIRPIVNLRRRTLGGSVNARLQTAFDVLALEAARRPGAYGAAVHGANAIHARLGAYKAALVAQYGRVPMLYAVRADVRAAFDSLDHARLLRLVRALLASGAAYVVQRYTQLKPALGRLARHTVRRAVDDAAYPRFLAVQPSARHAVVVDHVAYALTDAAQVLAQVERHITQSLVRFGRDLYRQRVGVPQGSVLSTVLCNLLLADVERAAQLTSLEGCLMRYTDDFLFLTPSRTDAARFCRALHTEFPRHGCAIAPEKTLVNFDIAVGAALVPRIDAAAPVPWCGYTICPTTLAVRADAARYPYHFGDTLTVPPTRRGAALAHRMLHAVRARTHVLFTSAQLNTPRDVYANLLEGAVVAAAKLHAYARALRPHRLRTAVVCDAVHLAVRTAYPMVVSRLRLVPGERTTVTRAAVEWVGYVGFYAVLGARPTYAGAAHALAAEVRRAKYAAARTELGRWALAEAQRCAEQVRARC